MRRRREKAQKDLEDRIRRRMRKKVSIRKNKKEERERAEISGGQD
jgi:hypothetical protein